MLDIIKFFCIMFKQYTWQRDSPMLEVCRKKTSLEIWEKDKYGCKDWDSHQVITVNFPYLNIEAYAGWKRLGKEITDISPEMLEVFKFLNDGHVHKDSQADKMKLFLQLVHPNDFLFEPPTVVYSTATERIPPLTRFTVTQTTTFKHERKAAQQSISKEELAFLGILHPRVSRTFFQNTMRSSIFHKAVLSLPLKLGHSPKEGGGKIGTVLCQLIKTKFPAPFPQMPFTVQAKYEPREGRLSIKAGYYYPMRAHPPHKLRAFFDEIYKNVDKTVTVITESCISNPTTVGQVQYVNYDYNIHFFNMRACQAVIEALTTYAEEPSHVFDLTPLFN